jgi:hypothetical protein
MTALHHRQRGRKVLRVEGSNLGAAGAAMGTQIGSAVPGSERLAADREWVRWGVGAAVTAMLAWVAGVALI